MTELSRDLRKYLALEAEITDFEKKLEYLFAVKTIIFQGMKVTPEEEIERLKANAFHNQEQAGKLENRIIKLTGEKNKLETRIKHSLPLYDQWVKVPKANGFFLIKKTKIERIDFKHEYILIVDEYNEREERINR